MCHTTNKVQINDRLCPIHHPIHRVLHRSLFSFFSQQIRCIPMNNLSNRLKSIGRIWCFSFSLSSMALPEWDIMSDDDHWKVSVFISAIVELFLSILLLLGAAIAFITSRFAKFFGLEPPCTYLGCSHPLHTELLKGERLPTPPSCKSKDLCRGEFCPDCHPLRIHSKLHFNSGSNQEEGSCSEGDRKRSAFGSRDHNATELDLDVSSGHSGECHEMPSVSPLYKRRNQRKGPKRTAFVHAASSSKLNEDDLPLLSARAGSESSGGFDAEGHCEISQVPVDSEEEWAWKETYVKRDNNVDNYVSLARDSEALKRLEDYNIKAHAIFPSLFKSNQAECAEPSPLYAVHDEFEEPKVSKNHFDKLDGHGLKFADLEKQRPSQCSEIVPSTDNSKGSSNDFDMLGSHLSWSSIDGQTTKVFCVPMKAKSVREGLLRNDGMVDACKEVHLNTHSPVYKDSRNKLVQGAELLDAQCRTKTDSEDLNNNIEQGKQKDSVVNIAINLGGDIQGIGSNVSESEKETQHLMSKKHLEPTDQNVGDDDCLKKDMVAAYLSYLELNGQEAITKGVQEASLDGADAPCEKNGRLLEGEKGVMETSCHLKHGELSVKDPGKDVSIATKDFHDEPTNAVAQCRRSSEHVEEMALSVSPLEAEDDEQEFILEEEQEEGLDALKVALRAERAVLAVLEAELENERNAAAVATSEAMAMISRLQEEKSAMQMEVAQLQRTSEEKADYDEQAMALLKEILFKREKENIALEKEVELYRETLLADKADEVKRNWLREETGSPSPQSLKPLLLTGGEEFLSPIEARNQKQAPWISQTRASLGLEELSPFSLDQNLNKRSADSPISDAAASVYFKLWDDEGRPRDYLDGGLHGAHNNSEQLEETGRSVFSTYDKETQLILERLWVLEEELQKLRGKHGSGSQSKAHGVQQFTISPTYRRADKILTESWGGQCVKSKEEKEEVKVDGVAEGFVPIHDVYEVQSSSNRSPPFAEGRDPPEGFQGISGNSELPPGSSSERFSRYRIQIPPRISLSRKLFPSDEAPCTPVFTPQASGWIVGKCSHPEDLCDHHELQAQSEERGMTREEIQQLAVRLKALEEDRELLRETLKSFKHRDAELNLLQEIAQHLRELRMAGFMRVSGGVFSEDVTVTSPSKNRALKKRRYCSGPGQAQLLLLQKKSI